VGEKQGRYGKLIAVFYGKLIAKIYGKILAVYSVSTSGAHLHRIGCWEIAHKQSYSRADA
jgi:hypothetical protein